MKLTCDVLTLWGYPVPNLTWSKKRNKDDNLTPPPLIFANFLKQQGGASVFSMTLREKKGGGSTITDKLKYIPNNDTQNYLFCRLQLMFVTFRHLNKWK